MRYRFAGFELDEAQHELTNDGRLVTVEPLVFDLILLLVRNAGQLITRDRLVEEIWNGRIVSDSAISACLASARAALGDSGKTQSVIRTVARRGVRLVATVECVETPAEDEPVLRQGRAVKHTFQEETQRLRYARSEEGHSIAYATTGSGPAVLYCRLSGAANLEMEWKLPGGRSFFDSVAQRFSVLRFDPVGSGMSERQTIETDFSRMARDAIRVADAAGIDRFSIYSTSGGVLPAAHVAANFPDRVKKLAIIGGYVDGRSRRQANPRADVIRELMANGWDEPESSFATAVLASYFPEGPFDTVKDFVRLMQSAVDKEHMLKLRDAINDASIEPLLARITCPTLIFHGRKDGIHPLSEAQKLAAGIRDAELITLETANHLPLPDTPVWDRFMETLIAFLAE